MPSERTLDPARRTLYCEGLRPPPDYVFDGAVSTTYTLDLKSALTAPVSLALFAAESGEALLNDPLPLLEGVQRVAGRMAIYTDAGRIHAVEAAQSRLCALLDRMIIQVRAPKGGAFHPKMWAIRFRPIEGDEPIKTRLMILSRNLTSDRSWDTALTLDGEVGGGPRSVNRPLYDFIRELPNLASAEGGVAEALQALTLSIAEDIRKTDWELPDNFESITFEALGVGGSKWRFEPCKRLGIVSPFCDNTTLNRFAGSCEKEKPILIGREDELTGLTLETLSNFAHVSVLDEAAVSADGEELSQDELRGLHAKIFVLEHAWDTTIVVGSANATSAALIEGKNVELVAKLTGKTSKIGSVAEILGDSGFGNLTRKFEPGELKSPDATLRQIEEALEAARTALLDGGLHLRCAPAIGRVDRWALDLAPAGALALSGVGKLDVWPITRGAAHRIAALAPLQGGLPVALGDLAIADLTRIVAFQIADPGNRVEPLIFSMALPIEGLPEARDAAILRTTIDTSGKFLGYLEYLLASEAELSSGSLRITKRSETGRAARGIVGAALFEQMVRTLCADRSRLAAIDGLVAKLERQGDGSSPIPEEFLTLWNAFRAAAIDGPSGND